MSTILEVKDIVKTYQKEKDTFNAIDTINFTLSKSEILGVIGNNGAGKSTLLKLLSRITAPTSGSIQYEGNLTSIIDIGTGFHPDLTGMENVYLTSRLINNSYDITPSTYNAIVQFSGLEDFMEVPVKNYSSGMYLRLAFSIAFHSAIDILLLDEIIAVGDQNFRKKCYEKIRELKNKKVGIILVSHDMESILEFCDRCILLNKGKIVAQGEPYHVVEKYLNWNISNQQTASIHKEFNTNEKGSIVNYHYDVKNVALDFIQIEKFEISCNGNEELYIENELTINLEFSNLLDSNSIEIGYYLTNINNVKIFFDSYGLREQYEPLNWARNSYTITCIIPKNLLNVGLFTLGVLISKNLTPQFEINRLATFKISSKLSGNRKFNNRLNCAVRPHLKWIIK